jgi:hypothetical protein
MRNGRGHCEIDRPKGARAVTQETVTLSVPFEALVSSIANLTLKDKLRLWKLIEEQIALAEEEALEQDPVVLAEIREARAAYRTGDYMTIDDYVAQTHEQAG